MRRATAIVTAFAVAAGFVLAAGCSLEGGDVGKAVGSGFALLRAAKPFSWDEEKEIGGTVAAKLASSYEIVRDPKIIKYVNLIAATISSYSERPEVLPRVLILKSDTPNAYACPGGYMFVTTGLLEICQDESELAGVLGHEFTHVAKRHSLSGLRWKRFISVGTKEATKYSPEQIQKAYPGFRGAIDKGINSVVNNRHGVAAEKQADESGAESAARAGYDPNGLGRFIERLPTGEKGRWLESLSVYKNGDTRAQNIIKSLEKKGVPTSGGVRNAARYKRELAGILK